MPRARRAPLRYADEYATKMEDEGYNYDVDEFALHMTEEGEPSSWTEAIHSPEADKWRKAAEEEYQSLQENQTWNLMKLPVGRQAVTSKWVFKKKRDEFGNVSRYKARLVARGFTQRHGIDFEETFAPVVRFETIRTLLAEVVQRNMFVHQMDVETAFLNGDLQEDVYLQQPEGFERGGSDYICKLKKSLYGLKQSPRCWNLKLHDYLIKAGYVQGKADPCVYHREKKTGIIAVYVDDLLLAADQEEKLKKMKQELATRFKMKDMGPLHFLLGVKISKVPNGLRLDQESYLRQLVQKFGLEDAKPTATPAVPNGSSEDGTTTAEMFADKTAYQRLVGSLLYAAVVTRPDVAHAVSYVCRFTSEPTQQHWVAAKRILRYLKGTITLGLVYTKQKHQELIGYVDADWGGDRVTRRSTTGYVFVMGGAAVSWLSKRQPIVTLSSTEAEYVALASATTQTVWLRRLLRDLGAEPTKPTLIYEDNQGCIALTKNPVGHKRSKHIDIKYHYAREQVEMGIVRLQYIESKEQVADVFTKALTRDNYNNLRRRLGLAEPSTT